MNMIAIILDDVHYSNAYLWRCIYLHYAKFAMDFA